MPIQSDLKFFSLLFAAVFALLIPAAAFAEPAVTIDTFDENINFSDVPVVRIQKGDMSSYKEVAFDDSSWEIVSLPSSWSDLFPNYNGICWYRIHLTFPENLPDRTVGIRLGVITDADETYFNGVLIGSSGKIADPAVSAYDKQRLYEIPTSLIEPGAENVLSIRVRGIFDYANGPSSGTFEIGRYTELLGSLLSRDFLELFLVVVYLVVAGYFFLFFIRRTSDKENLLFALFALAMGMYFALRSQIKYLIDADFFVMKKIEYLVLSLLVVLLTEFLFQYFKKKRSIANYIFIGITAVNFSVFAFSSSFTFWDTYNQFVQLPSFFIGVVLSLYVLVTNFKKERDAKLMLYALVILLGAMINDILLNMAAYQFIRLTAFGFFFFVVAIAIILSNRFVRLYGEVEDLNRNLEIRVEDRTRELNETVVDLEEAKAETDNLLENVQEGIFLLDQNLTIGDHYSKMLEVIFEGEELGGMGIVELLSKVLNPDQAEQTKEFLDIAMTKKLSTKRLRSLNPVDEATLTISKEDEIKEKFVRFMFTPIGPKGDYTHILGTVQDVTEEKILEQKFIESEQRAQDEMKLLLGILHLDPNVVRTFLTEARDEIASIEKQLENAQFTDDLHEPLITVYRSLHTIKGNASVLDLEMFIRQTHQFEEKIETLQRKEELVSLDLLHLLYEIVGLKEALEQVEGLLNRITGFQKEFGGESGTVDSRQILVETVKDLAERVAERESKEVEVDAKDFKVPIDGSIDLPTTKTLLVQLVRNAVTHGIEQPEARESEGKSRTGRITLTSDSDDGTVAITVQDDGRGIQVDDLRKKAIEMGAYTEEQLKDWPREKLVQLLFVSGMSTQAEATIDAGRGMGMDIVRQKVMDAGGKISLSYIPNQQTRFTIRLPRAERAE